MNITECNKHLRILTDAHEAYRISMVDYRQQRKQLLDNLDKNLNGTDPMSPVVQEQPPLQTDASSSDDIDKTQPYFSAKLGKCISFLKGNNDR